MAEIKLNEAETIEKIANQYGKKYANNGISSSQLRRIYAEVKRAENKIRHAGSVNADKNDESAATTIETAVEEAQGDLKLLEPHLAYAASRNDEMEVVMDDLTKLMDKYSVFDGGKTHLELFFKTMEAIIAYHAYYDETGGR